MNSSAVTVESLDAEAAARHAEAWRVLAARAAEGNAFYEPAVALAALRHLNPRSRVLMAWREGGLIGVWPVDWKRGRFVMPLPLLAAEPAYAPLTTPLLDKDHAEDAARALLEWVRASGAQAFHVPKLSEKGAAGQALERAANALGMKTVRINPHVRACISAEADAELPKKSRHDLQRLRRRLGEQGNVTLTIARAPEDVPAALREFLELEKSGWKGKTGNPLGGNEAELGFIADAASGLAEQAGMRVVLLRMDGRPIAGGLVLSSAGRAFYFKTAYDEAFARYSPGTLITEDIARLLLDAPEISFVDSVADPNHPLMDRMWRGRLPISDWMIAPQGGGVLFRVITLLEMTRQDARRIARRLLKG
jgi:CelD/BcsL family acetyltransferase involved in cellulose biosynthesis